MDFFGGTEMAARVFGTDDCADGWSIAGRSFEADAQAGLRVDILEEFCGGAILGDDQVNAAVLIEVADGGTALVAVKDDTGFLSWNGRETACAIAAQPKSASAVLTGPFGAHWKKVLAQEDVFMAVAIEIGHADREGRCPLRFGGQGNGQEVCFAI